MGYSNDNFWKLDKWDKIGISSLIVFFTIFVVLNTFSFGTEVQDVSYSTLANVSFGTSGVFVEGGNLAYFTVEPRL